MEEHRPSVRDTFSHPTFWSACQPTMDEGFVTPASADIPTNSIHHKENACDVDIAAALSAPGDEIRSHEAADEEARSEITVNVSCQDPPKSMADIMQGPVYNIWHAIFALITIHLDSIQYLTESKARGRFVAQSLVCAIQVSSISKHTTRFKCNDMRSESEHYAMTCPDRLSCLLSQAQELEANTKRQKKQLMERMQMLSSTLQLSP
ncbi:hypothetical protein CAPTEDRAFT_209958 [Capitella teleta]|uniref:Uncharacterized protein n=1 Tax=Capitella teleta TaxID=283909 RepID=R7V0I4_CAPTE|nr:hypothetical protein CAPTEDRAFT_209958 [Capitella teleta]|eukprot:ELU09717.1 hypothetical protein CAPTEDRAFT_209958 [Capitella teleta]